MGFVSTNSHYYTPLVSSVLPTLKKLVHRVKFVISRTYQGLVLLSVFFFFFFPAELSVYFTCLQMSVLDM
jgi:hypothetical protein